MYVCICKQVTDSDIKQAVDNGVKSMRVLKSRLPLGENCGKCYPVACQIFRQSLSLQQTINK